MKDEVRAWVNYWHLSWNGGTGGTGGMACLLSKVIDLVEMSLGALLCRREIPRKNSFNAILIVKYCYY